MAPVTKQGVCGLIKIGTHVADNSSALGAPSPEVVVDGISSIKPDCRVASTFFGMPTTFMCQSLLQRNQSTVKRYYFRNMLGASSGGDMLGTVQSHGRQVHCLPIRK